VQLADCFAGMESLETCLGLGLEMVLMCIFNVLVLRSDVLVLQPSVLILVLRKMSCKSKMKFSTSVASYLLTV